MKTTPTPDPEFIAHDWCGWLDRYGRFTHVPSGKTLLCQRWMDQGAWDKAQLTWFREFSTNLIVHDCPTGPYNQNGPSMGTVGEIISRLEGRVGAA